MAFFIVGARGWPRRFWPVALPEPVRGASEGVDTERLKAASGPCRRDDYFALMVNASYIYAVLGMAAYTFAIGGNARLGADLLFSTRRFDQVAAGTILGVVDSVRRPSLGMSAGGWIADRLARTKPQALFLVPASRCSPRSRLCWPALFSHLGPVIFAAIFLAEALMFVNTGPCNAIIANVVQPNLRAAAYAITIFAVHFLGDIWSPVADRQGVRPVRR